VSGERDLARAAPRIALDHRGLQRTVFRMQLDPRFAALLQARDPGALRSTGLAAAELALIEGIDLRAVAADPGDRRRTQFLRNVSSEFPLTLAVAPADVAQGFPGSSAFHDAVAAGGRLPLAFAAYLAQALAGAEHLVRALLELEMRLAHARRATPPPAPELPAQRVALAPEIELATLPEGTFAAASAIRSALDQRKPIVRPSERHWQDSETLLIQPQPSATPFALGSVHIERLAPAVADLLRQCRSAQSAQALVAYAEERGIDREDVLGVVESFRADGVLLGRLG
jgi:hypothetical protein